MLLADASGENASSLAATLLCISELARIVFLTIVSPRYYLLGVSPTFLVPCEKFS